MNYTRLISIAALLTLATLGGAEWWQRRVHRDRVAALAESLRRLDAERRAEQRRLMQEQRDLNATSPDAATTPAPAVVPGLLAAPERAHWLARTRELKRLFTTRPDQAIPELRLLTDRDWLWLAKNVRFDTEENIRRALAQARGQAKNHFTGQLDHALRAYTRDSGDQLPATLDQLVPFFETPPDPAMLQRYAMTRTGSSKGNPMHWAIEERQLIDERFDAHFHVQASGGYGSTSSNGDTLGAKIQGALRAFQRANNGRLPSDNADLAPYLPQALTPAEWDQLHKAEKRSK